MLLTLTIVSVPFSSATPDKSPESQQSSSETVSVALPPLIGVRLSLLLRVDWPLKPGSTWVSQMGSYDLHIFHRVLSLCNSGSVWLCGLGLLPSLPPYHPQFHPNLYLQSGSHPGSQSEGTENTLGLTNWTKLYFHLNFCFLELVTLDLCPCSEHLVPLSPCASLLHTCFLNSSGI